VIHTLALFGGAGVLPFVSSLTYIVSILRGRARPQRMTRLLLVVITGLSFTALLVGQDRSGGFWLALTALIQAVVIWLLALKYGMGGRERLDWVCFGLCGLGVLLWLLFTQSLIGLLLSIAADCVAIVPSLRKTIKLPHTESLTFFAVDTVAGLLVLVAGPYTWRTALYPLYIAAINGVYVFVLLRPRILKV